MQPLWLTAVEAACLDDEMAPAIIVVADEGDLNAVLDVVDFRNGDDLIAAAGGTWKDRADAVVDAYSSDASLVTTHAQLITQLVLTRRVSPALVLYVAVSDGGKADNISRYAARVGAQLLTSQDLSLGGVE